MAKTFDKFLSGNTKSRAFQNGFDDIGNCDVFDEMGFCKASKLFETETDANSPDEGCLTAVTPLGTVYFFSITTSGKIWKRTAAGVWSTVTANSNGAHTGCAYFETSAGQFIFYWTTSKIGRFIVETEASRNDSWNTASNSTLGGHAELNEALWLTDKNYIARIGLDDTFTANSLDLPDKWTAYLAIDDINNLLIGADMGDKTAACRFFLWDTYSDSWTLEDEVPEKGANTFVRLDNMILAQCGGDGRLFYWTGNRMEKFTNRLRNVNEGGVITEKGYQKSGTWNGRAIIMARQFVFSVHREFSGEDIVVVRENTVDQGFGYSIAATSTDLFISSGNAVGKISDDTYRRAAIITPEVRGTFSNVIVGYDEKPELIGIETKSNKAASFTAQTAIVDSVRRIVYFDGGLLDCRQLQARILLNVDETTPESGTGDVTPIIKSVTLT